MPPSTEKQCLRCGAPFGCGASAGEKTCWCADLPRVMPVDDAGCLCPTCLKAAVEAKIAVQGLCASCQNARSLRSKGGGEILFCELSGTDGRYAKYPALPRRECSGYRTR